MRHREVLASLAVAVGESDHVQGSDRAAVTLVEYGDYECPACGQAYAMVKELQQRLGDQLRFVFRNFPLTQVHPRAEQAAEAAEAAASQSSFWPMHDLLYENQNALETDDLLQYAADLGLDEARFISELDGHVHAARIRHDFMSGVRSGVNGTPTFFINGARHDRSFDVVSLLEAIDDEMAHAGGRRH